LCCVTAEPVSTTTPAASQPRIIGLPSGGGRLLRTLKSTGLTEIARTSTADRLARVAAWQLRELEAEGIISRRVQPPSAIHPA